MFQFAEGRRKHWIQEWLTNPSPQNYNPRSETGYVGVVMQGLGFRVSSLGLILEPLTPHIKFTHCGIVAYFGNSEH